MQTTLTKACREIEDLRQQLDERGFCVVSEVLPVERLREVRERLSEQAECERAAQLAYQNPGHLDNQ